MDPTFITKVCAKCPHYMAIGNGAKGGLRSQKCYFARDDVQDAVKRSNMQGFKHGQSLEKLETCPDPKMKEKVTVMQGCVTTS
jgi:hypothetical protein